MLVILYFLTDLSAFIKTILSIYVFFRLLSPEIILQGYEEYALLAYVNILSKIFQLLLIFILDFDYNGLSKAFILATAVPVITNLFLYFYLFKKYSPRMIRLELSKIYVFFKESINFYFARVCLNLYTQGSTYIVSFFISLESLAIYSLATDFYKVGSSFIGGIARVLFTKLNMTTNFSLLRKLTIYSCFVVVAFLPIVVFYGDDALKLVFNINITELHSLSIYLYISLIFIIINSFWGYPAFSPINKDFYAHISLIGSSLIYFSAFAITSQFFEINIFNAIMLIITADFFGSILRLTCAYKVGVLFKKQNG